MRLREELDREREERNYFQLERDKIHSFWKITERQLEEVKAEQKNFDQDIEEDEGRHQVEIKVKLLLKCFAARHANTENFYGRNLPSYAGHCLLNRFVNAHFIHFPHQVYKQKMKHLLCEHQNTISELRADALVSTQAGQKEQGQLEAQLHKEMKAIMVDKQEHDNENLVKELDLVCSSNFCYCYT